MTASDGRATLLSHVTERQWQSQVLLWARNREWLRYHVHDSRQQEWDSDAGFPDLVLVRSPRILIVELKTIRGFVSTKQAVWLASLRACPGVETHVWRPTDEDAVKAALQ